MCFAIVVGNILWLALFPVVHGLCRALVVQGRRILGGDVRVGFAFSDASVIQLRFLSMCGCGGGLKVYSCVVVVEGWR